MTLQLARPVHKAACSPTIFRAPHFLRPKTTTNFFRPLTTMAPTTAASPSLPPDRRPLIISGPSGVGKGTLFNLLCERHPRTFTLSVSHTTRAPRDGETNGVHYNFVTHDEFAELVAADGFVEHASFSGNSYGTSRQTIADQTAKDRVVVLDIEMEGVKQIKQSGMDARYVFVAPPSEAVLEQRLRGRGTEKEESVQKRLTQAKLELEYSKTPGVHDLIVGNSYSRGMCLGKIADTGISVDRKRRPRKGLQAARGICVQAHRFLERHDCTNDSTELGLCRLSRCQYPCLPLCFQLLVEA